MPDQVEDTIAATNRLMLRADAYCQNNSSCPFYGLGKGSVPKFHVFTPETDILLTMTQAFKQVVEIAKETPFFSPCVNTTFCHPYSTDFNVRVVLYRNTAVPDFPAILDGIHYPLNGDPAYFINGPPSLEDVVAMPLLSNDYSQFKNLTYSEF